jgi:SAM-dependent methyltransferase
MKPACFVWRHDSAAFADYVPVLDRLGADPDTRDWAFGFARHHAGRLKWDVNLIIENFRPSRLLNVGAAPYVFEHLLRQALPDIEVVSIDLDPDRFPRVREELGIEVVGIDIERESIAALGTFTVVIFCEIFEHLRSDLLGTMRRITSAVDPGGILYLTTPNGLGLEHWSRLLGGRTGPVPVHEWSKLVSIGHMGHVREYSVREVSEVLADVGLTVERVIYRRHRKRPFSRLNAARLAAEDFAVRSFPALGEEIVLIARRYLS